MDELGVGCSVRLRAADELEAQRAYLKEESFRLACSARAWNQTHSSPKRHVRSASRTVLKGASRIRHHLVPVFVVIRRMDTGADASCAAFADIWQS